jgi:pyrimidine deaminase RibD-like protein
VQPHDAGAIQEAIDWAANCNPSKASIPKVGAIIVAAGKIIGRGRRGTGISGDDDHAEFMAIGSVKDKALMAGATLYTTLEPCTPNVRSRPLEACTQLILQHRFSKVFIGILDPNQAVTGRGLWALQDAGVDVELFPHTLAQQIRTLNAAFIRAQQSWGPSIVSPLPAAAVRGASTVVQFTCNNPPAQENFLLVQRSGFWWPQSSSFRAGANGLWEVDAHFGVLGDHTIHLVTVTELGQVLVQFHRQMVEENQKKRERLRAAQVDLGLLGSDYPGIPMIGPPKGIRSEASVTVTVERLV